MLRIKWTGLMYTYEYEYYIFCSCKRTEYVLKGYLVKWIVDEMSML